jgi:hypothetical protein
MKAQRVHRVIAVLVNLSATWRWVVSAMPQPLYPWEADVEPIEREADWAQWLVW